MNTLGRLFRVSILGESHGSGVGVLIDGCPSGVPFPTETLAQDLARRRPGAPGTTPRKERDEPRIQSGVFRGTTTGSPILIFFENQDVASGPYRKQANTPRPGHADFVAHHKFSGFSDFRGGGHFSGRLTTGVVAAGALAKQILAGVCIRATLLEAGGAKDYQSTVRSAQKDGDSVGGLIQCVVSGLPIGLGEPFFDSVESVLSHAIFAIPGIKGIEFGAGFSCTTMRGSEFNDEILDVAGTTKTNHSGGINGGITNGNDLGFRVAVRPTASIGKTQTTVNVKTGAPTSISVKGRHDACIALRVPVILEAMTAIVLADLTLLNEKTRRKDGGDRKGQEQR